MKAWNADQVPDQSGRRVVVTGASSSGFLEMRGNPTQVQATPMAHDPAIGLRLWAVSEELTGVTFRLPEPIS